MRKRQRAEHRKRKILKLDEEGVSLLPDCQLTICHVRITVVLVSVDFIFMIFCMQGAQSDSEEESVTSDLKDLEFKLLHDLSQFQVHNYYYVIISFDVIEFVICILSHRRKLLM